MASPSRHTAETDLGIVEGWSGETLSGSQLAETRVDVPVTGPLQLDQASFVVLELCLHFPASPEKELELELPIHKAKQLRDTLDRLIAEADCD
jgi:uncharacterized protein YecA (UPF0149 family)